MMEVIQANWIVLVAALVIGILVAWWMFVVNRKATVEREEKPEDGAPAKRNQALIDSAPAASPVPPQQVAEPVPADQPAPAPAVPPAAAAGGDDLTRIKGLGPKIQTLLHGLGITSFAQIAEWGEAEIDEVDGKLGNFQGRIRRDSWVEQARFLAAGDTAGYEGRFGKL